MRYDSDISKLISAMTEEQRIEFKTLILSFKTDGLDEKLSSNLSKISCDDILEDIESTIYHENRRKITTEAANNGKTTIPESDWGVHISHCCSIHGCKYGDIDCPVILGLAKQKYSCEFCNDNEFDFEL